MHRVQQKRSMLYTEEDLHLCMCQKRPVYVSKRDLYMCKESSNIYIYTYIYICIYTEETLRCLTRGDVSNETYVCVKRDLCICQKSPTKEICTIHRGNSALPHSRVCDKNRRMYVSKETYICAKSPNKRDIYHAHEKFEHACLTFLCLRNTLQHTLHHTSTTHHNILQQHTATAQADSLLTAVSLSQEKSPTEITQVWCLEYPPV